uniref:RRM domain-containing protein n=1 Tax=Arcella intermedia TaxID=1963864 RepID=A0A6B2LCA6_9EUKA
MLSQVSPILSFRLVTERETGKSKGFGFCDYRDVNAALAAIRALNGREINGRVLKVDFADDKTPLPMDLPKQDFRFQPTRPPAQVPLGPKEDVGLQSDIGKVLEGMTSSQLYEVMVQLKGLYQKSPERVTALLRNNPPFAYALLKTQIMLGMITQDIAKQIIPTALPSPMVLPTPVMGGAIPGMTPSYLPPVPVPVAPVHGFPPVSAPVGGIGKAPPPNDLNSVLGEEQRALLEQVMKLTPEQIEKLKPQERQQIMQLRKTMVALNYGMPLR